MRKRFLGMSQDTIRQSHIYLTKHHDRNITDYDALMQSGGAEDIHAKIKTRSGLQRFYEKWRKEK